MRLYDVPYFGHHGAMNPESAVRRHPAGAWPFGGAARAWLLLAAALVAFGVHAQPKDGGPIRSFEITQNDDTYVANIAMYAPAPLAVAWSVLTDFDNMSKWVPNVKESSIKAKDGNTMTVEQRGTARFGLLSFPYTSVRRMDLDPQKSILSTQVQGSMKKVVSLMKLTPDASGTRLDYRIEIVPSGLAASVLSKDFLKNELTEQFTAIVGEINRRAKQ
jgi:carbon monoxide dehydrogenase subunit G